MSVMFLLLCISVVFIIFIAAFLYWSTVSGQFDNLSKNSKSILEDDDSNNN